MARNTFLLVSVLAVVAALLVGLNIGRQLSASAPTITQVQETPTPTPKPLSEYTNTSCGVSFTIPEGYTLSPAGNASMSAIFVGTGSDKPITFVCQSEIPRVPLSPEKIETVSVGSVSAKLYHDTDAKEGNPIDKLIFTHPKNRLDIFLAGAGNGFQKLVATIMLLP